MLRESPARDLPTSLPSSGGRNSFSTPSHMLDHGRDIAIPLLRSFVDRPSYVLGVTSAVPGEGKTTVSLSLAEIMAADFGVKVLFIDAHAERPWAQSQDDLAGRRGLSDWLSDETSLPEALLSVLDKCSALPFGQQKLTSRDLLQHLVKAETLPGLRQDYGLILLDLPDMTNPATPALANLCDGIILVARAGVTPADQVRAFLPLLKSVMVHGVVLNRRRSRVPALFRRLFE